MQRASRLPELCSAYTAMDYSNELLLEISVVERPQCRWLDALSKAKVFNR